MDEGTGDRLPVVDLEAFRFDEAGAGRIASSLDAIFRDIGFCYIANTGIDPALVTALFDASRRFHAQPREAKDRIAINRFHRGYMAPKSSLIVTSSVQRATKPNNSESFMLMHEVPPDDPRHGQSLQGPNQWPTDLPGFREAVTVYNTALETLAKRFTRLIARALDLPPDGLDPYFEKPTTFLRLLHYPPQPPDAAEDEFGSNPHTDYGFITILLQDEVGGLQVRRRDGTWLPATPIPGTFVVNVADMLSRWTNGRWQSTPHGVKNRSAVDRYSAPFFFDPSMDSLITCLPTCTSSERPPLYEPVLYGDYLLERIDKNYDYRRRI
jgi:isopenicillin N synthase-like dioxygenase